MAVTTAPLDEPGRRYGSRLTAVEPGGAEAIPLGERHGKPYQQALLWTSPNMEFATVFIGVIAVLLFGLSFWWAVVAIVLGNALGAVCHGTLASWGPRSGLGQMALGRKPFGFYGNLLPAGINASLGGLGWLAVNSVSGALAVSTLTGWSPYPCLVVEMAITLGIAFFGHNVVQLFERLAFPILTAVFVIGAALVLAQAQPEAAVQAVPGGFWITFGSAFASSGGWGVSASDYARYLRPDQSLRAGLFAGLGIFLSTTLLQVAGAAAVTAVGVSAWSASDPVSSYAQLLPGWLGKLTLVGVFIGALSANSLNLYSSSLSLAAMGIRLPTRFGRAILSLLIGSASLTIALFAVNDIDDFASFLLVIAYWVAPWLGVVLADRVLWRTGYEPSIYTDRRHTNWAGPAAMLAGIAISVPLFANQSIYVGPVPAAWPALGDITFEVGFLVAVLTYAGMLARGSRVTRRISRGTS